MRRKDRKMEEYRFGKTCSTSSRAGHYRKAFAVNHPSVWQHGLAHGRADGRKTNSRPVTGEYMRQLQLMCGSLSRQRTGEPRDETNGMSELCIWGSKKGLEDKLPQMPGHLPLQFGKRKQEAWEMIIKKRPQQK